MSEYSMVSSNGNLFKVPIDENDIVGERYGNVTVLEYIGFEHKQYSKKSNRKQKVHWYRVQCDCGKIWNARRSDIISLRVTTCGKCLLSNKYGSLGNLLKRKKRGKQNGSCEDSNKDESSER